MRRNVLPVIGIGIAVLLVSTIADTAAASTPTASPPTATTSVSADRPSTRDVAASSAAVCGTGYRTWTGTGITSQYFGTGLGVPVGTLAADDFKCTGGTAARTIKTVKVAGIGEPMNMNFSVSIYRQKNVGVGPQPNDGTIWACRTETAVGVFSATGPTGQEWTIPLDEGCVLKKRMARKGVWLDVQANLDLIEFGQWFWGTQAEQGGRLADWRNPDNYFGSNCLTYSANIGAPDVGADNYMKDCLPGDDFGRSGLLFTLLNT